MALLAQLNDGSALLDALFRDAYVHIFQSTLLMPLMGAYELLNGQVDPFLFAVAPLNIIIFIPLCFAGQVSERPPAASAQPPAPSRQRPGELREAL